MRRKRRSLDRLVPEAAGRLLRQGNAVHQGPCWASIPVRWHRSLVFERGGLGAVVAIRPDAGAVSAAGQVGWAVERRRTKCLPLENLQGVPRMARPVGGVAQVWAVQEPLGGILVGLVEVARGVPGKRDFLTPEDGLVEEPPAAGEAAGPAVGGPVVDRVRPVVEVLVVAEAQRVQLGAVGGEALVVPGAPEVPGGLFAAVAALRGRDAGVASPVALVGVARAVVQEGIEAVHRIRGLAYRIWYDRRCQRGALTAPEQIFAGLPRGGAGVFVQRPYDHHRSFWLTPRELPTFPKSDQATLRRFAYRLQG